MRNHMYLLNILYMSPHGTLWESPLFCWCIEPLLDWQTGTDWERLGFVNRTIAEFVQATTSFSFKVNPKEVNWWAGLVSWLFSDTPFVANGTPLA